MAPTSKRGIAAMDAHRQPHEFENSLICGQGCQRERFGQTALHLASANGSIDMVRYLIEKQKMIADSTDYFGHTALHLASQRSR
jgi:Ankyrin repeats (3 copies)